MPDISEKSFEATIEAELLWGPGEQDKPPQSTLRDGAGIYDVPVTGRYQRRTTDQYDRELCLIPTDVLSFLLATQPQEWERLKKLHRGQAKARLLKRLAAQIKTRGTLTMLRKGLSEDGPAHPAAGKSGGVRYEAQGSIIFGCKKGILQTLADQGLPFGELMAYGLELLSESLIVTFDQPEKADGILPLASVPFVYDSVRTGDRHHPLRRRAPIGDSPQVYTTSGLLSSRQTGRSPRPKPGQEIRKAPRPERRRVSDKTHCTVLALWHLWKRAFSCSMPCRRL